MANVLAGLFGKAKKNTAQAESVAQPTAVEYRLENLLKDILSIGRYLLRNRDTELQVEIGKDVPSVLRGDAEGIRKRFEGIVQKAIEVNHGPLVKILVSFRATEWKKGEVCFVIETSKPVEVFTYTIHQDVVDYRPFTEINELSEEEKDAGFQVADTKVMVVDDNITLLKMAKQMLSQYGCTVTCASSGEEAIRKLQSDFFQLVFLDLMMPEMDGFEVAARIRALGGEFRRIPIIALSGNAVVGYQGRCFEVGMDDYLAKPMHMDKLGEILRKYIKEDRIAVVKQTPVEVEDGRTSPEQERFLQRLVGFDVKEGLHYCMEDVSIYISVARSYYEDSLEDRIEEAYLARDLENYTIYVHALKSTSKSIGAMRLAEMAYQLELAGKRGDEDFISENHVVCMEVYKEHLDVLRVALSELGEEEEENKETKVHVFEGDVIDDFFEELRRALDDMNPQQIEAAVASLGMVAFRNSESNQVLSQIRNLTTNYDFMEAREKLEELVSLEKSKC